MCVCVIVTLRWSTWNIRWPLSIASRHLVDQTALIYSAFGRWQLAGGKHKFSIFQSFDWTDYIVWWRCVRNYGERGHLNCQRNRTWRCFWYFDQNSRPNNCFSQWFKLHGLTNCCYICLTCIQLQSNGTNGLFEWFSRFSNAKENNSFTRCWRCHRFITFYTVSLYFFSPNGSESHTLSAIVVMTRRRRFN